MNDIIITPPEGYEIDKENSTFECIKFKPKKEFTYDDIVKTLFLYKSTYFIGTLGSVLSTISDDRNYSDLNNAASKKQCERLLAINQLMNVAHYFNEIVDKDVKPIGRFTPVINTNETIGQALYCLENKNCLVWFKTRKSLTKAIKILGEETVKLAISL